jgi:hypothetical protein
MASFRKITLGLSKVWEYRPLLHRLLPYFGGIVIALLAEYVIYRPEFWKISIVASWLVIVIVSWAIDNKERRAFDLWSILFRPAFFSTWGICLILFVGTVLSRHLLALSLAIVPIIYWENLWRYAWAPDRYNPESLENISIALDSLAVWYVGLLFYNLLLDSSVLQFSAETWSALWQNNAALVATALTMLSVFLMDFNTLWLKRYDQEKTKLWIIVTTLIIGEVFWVINYLPHAVPVKAALLVFSYYLLTSLGRAHLDGTLRLVIIRRYVYLSAVILVLIFTTSRWLV